MGKGLVQWISRFAFVLFLGFIGLSLPSEAQAQSNCNGECYVQQEYPWCVYCDFCIWCNTLCYRWSCSVCEVWGCPISQGIEKSTAPGKQTPRQAGGVGSSCPKVDLARIVVTKTERISPRT